MVDGKTIIDPRKNPTRADELPGHIVVVDTVYCQMPGDQPVALECRSSRMLRTREQLFERRLTVGSDWVPVDTGWIESASVLVIQHRTPYDPLVNPTPEQRRADAELRLEVALQDGAGGMNVLCPIPPGEDMRMPNPVCIRDLRVRAVGGVARVVVVVFPE